MRDDASFWHAPCLNGFAPAESLQATHPRRAAAEGTTMEWIRSTRQTNGLQTLLVKLALSFGIIFWLFLVATFSHG